MLKNILPEYWRGPGLEKKKVEKTSFLYDTISIISFIVYISQIMLKVKGAYNRICMDVHTISFFLHYLRDEKVATIGVFKHHCIEHTFLSLFLKK